MATDESARLHLLEQARLALGDPAAGTLMTALPWAPDRLATKDDLAALSTELRGELHRELGGLRGELHTVAAQSLRTMVVAMLATNATLAGLVLGAVQLAA